MSVGEIILAVITFLSYPTWHLVVVYIILFILIIFSMVKGWGFTAKG